MLKKLSLIILILIIFIKINCSEISKVYEGYLIIPGIPFCEYKDLFDKNNEHTKFIINKPKFNNTLHNNILIDVEIKVDNFKTNPWLANWLSLCLKACCCLKNHIWLPLNFLKKNDKEFKSDGDIICLLIRDSQNNIVQLKLEIVDKRGYIKFFQQ